MSHHVVDVREAAQNRWREILPRCGVSPSHLTGKHQPCPGCGDRDRFRFDDQRGRDTFICSQGGGEPLAGDGFDFIQHLHECPFSDAVHMVADILGMADGTSPPRVPAKPKPAPPQPKSERRTTLAERERERWSRTRVITEADPAGRYLLGRGCALPPNDCDVRWHPRVSHWRSDHQGPAIICLISDFRTCEPVSLHFTWIRPDGSGKAHIEDNKLTLPQHTNIGVIRVFADDSVTTGLAIAEGLEYALNVARGFVPVWSTVNASNMAKFPVLSGIEALTIIADAENAGLKAAAACADRWDEAGREVRVWRAAEDGQDPNDVWGSAA